MESGRKIQISGESPIHVLKKKFFFSLTHLREGPLEGQAHWRPTRAQGKFRTTGAGWIWAQRSTCCYCSCLGNWGGRQNMASPSCMEPRRSSCPWKRKGSREMGSRDTRELCEQPSHRFPNLGTTTGWRCDLGQVTYASLTFFICTTKRRLPAVWHRDAVKMK